MLGFVELTEDVKKLKQFSQKQQRTQQNEIDKKYEVISLDILIQRLLNVLVFIQQLYVSKSSSININMNTNVSEECQSACTSLHMYFKTALEHPTVPRYRRIAIENQRFKSSLVLLLNTSYTYPSDANNNTTSMSAPSAINANANTTSMSAPSAINDYPNNSNNNWTVCDEIMACVGFYKQTTKGLYYEWLWLEQTDRTNNINNNTKTVLDVTNQQQHQYDSLPEVTSLSNMTMTMTNSDISSSQSSSQLQLQTETEQNSANSRKYKFSPQYKAYMQNKNLHNVSNSNNMNNESDEQLSHTIIPEHNIAINVIQECLQLLTHIKNGVDLRYIHHNNIPQHGSYNNMNNNYNANMNSSYNTNMNTSMNTNVNNSITSYLPFATNNKNNNIATTSFPSSIPGHTNSINNNNSHSHSHSSTAIHMPNTNIDNNTSISSPYRVTNTTCTPSSTSMRKVSSSPPSSPSLTPQQQQQHQQSLLADTSAAGPSTALPFPEMHTHLSNVNKDRNIDSNTSSAAAAAAATTINTTTHVTTSTNNNTANNNTNNTKFNPGSSINQTKTKKSPISFAEASIIQIFETTYLYFTYELIYFCSILCILYCNVR